MFRVILILVLLLAYLDCHSQQFVKEVNYYNGFNQLVSTEREYKIEPTVRLYCRYDGLEMTFKHVKLFRDSTIVLWKKEKMGDPNYCFCITSSGITFKDSQYVCQKGPRERRIIYKDYIFRDVPSFFRELNIKKFQEFKGVLSSENVHFDSKEKFFYTDGKLMRKESYQKGNLENTVHYTYTDNAVRSKRINSKSLRLESENEITIDEENEIIVLIRKKYLNDIPKVKRETICLADYSSNYSRLTMKNLKYELFESLQDRMFELDKNNFITMHSTYFKTIRSNKYKRPNILILKNRNSYRERISLINDVTKDLIQHIEIINRYNKLNLKSYELSSNKKNYELAIEF